MVSQDRILIACMGVNREPYLREVEYLFRTLKSFGGKLAYSRKAVCFTEEIDHSLEKRLTNLGIKVKILQPLTTHYPHANKLLILRLAQEIDCDYLVALDTDIVVTRDFLQYLEKPSFQARPVGNDPLTIDEWKLLYEYFKLELPTDRYVTCFNLKETIPYFNSGVILIPKKYVSLLYESWKSYCSDLPAAYQKLPQIAKHDFFTDQFALSLALNFSKIPYDAAPLEMNFPIQAPINPAMKPEKLNPCLLHYHHRISSQGHILPSPYRHVNDMIEKINRSLHETALFFNYRNKTR